MKKQVFILICAYSGFMLGMQQVGLSQASAYLAAMSPKVTGSARSYSSSHDKTAWASELLSKNNAVIDTYTRDSILKKYPDIKEVPPIYKFTPAKLELSDALPYRLKKIVAPHRVGIIPDFGGGALKAGYHTSKMAPILMYNPASYKSQEELEFVMLHELGHINRDIYFKLASWTANGIKASVIVAVFLQMITIKYGIIGYAVAPKLFWNLYVRFLEEPAADDFAVRHAHKATLEGGKQYFTRFASKTSNHRPIQILMSPHHPSLQSRIHKIQRAIDGHPNYNKLIRLGIIFLIVEKITAFLYEYSTNPEKMRDGLRKIEGIEQSFEASCDAYEIPEQGRPIYKNALDMAKHYLETKLVLTLSKNQDIKDDEVIEVITAIPEGSIDIALINADIPETSRKMKPFLKDIQDI